MSRTKTAVLLSALVLPGAGHLYLKHAARGMALIAVSLACLWAIVDGALQQAWIVLDQVESGNVALDAGNISEWAAQTSAGAGSSVATFVLIGCWLAGMVDAYRLGKRPG
jgi:hypothetical protein